LIRVAEASMTALPASDSRITEIRPTSFSLYCTRTLSKDTLHPNNSLDAP
jgi:hypothetical protein